MKSNFLYALIVPITIIAGCSSNQEKKQASVVPEVPIATVTASDELIYTEYPAKLEGQTDVEIRSQVSGILEKILVAEGSYVEAGTPLFQIDSRPFREEYNNTQGELMAAKAGVATARLEVEKLTPLVQNKVVSSFQLKLAQSAYDAAQAREKQAQAKAGNSRITLGYATIKAPVSGYVGRLSKKAGSLVAPGDIQALTYLSDNREVRAYFSVGESDFVNLKEGLSGSTISQKLKNSRAVTLLLSGGAVYTHTGTLDMVDAAFDKNTGSITLRATFPNKQGLLRSGNSGKVKLGVKQSGIIEIPQAATFEMQDKIFAFTIDNGSKAHQVPLTISGTTGNSYYISEGLKSGDRIVLKGMSDLKDGMLVKAESAKQALAIN